MRIIKQGSTLRSHSGDIYVTIPSHDRHISVTFLSQYHNIVTLTLQYRHIAVIFLSDDHHMTVT